MPNIVAVVVVGLAVISASAGAEPPAGQDLAKQSQNPLGKVISLQYQVKFLFPK